jgi:hypothetical protein
LAETVILATPAAAISATLMAACKVLLETNVVARAAPFHSTVEDDAKLVPVTVNVKAAPPAIAEPGVNNVIVGTGVVIVNVRAAEVPPPGEGLNTVTLAVLTELMSAAVMAACKLVLETKVVERVLPFHCTVDVGMKFVPVTVNVKPAPPAEAELGFKDVTVGEGLPMVKVSTLDVPPPGVGVETVTVAVPLAAMSAAVMAACSWVVDPKVVGRALPFQFTVESEIKFVPLTVSVKLALPTGAELGLSDATVGTGLLEVVGLKPLQPAINPVATTIATRQQTSRFTAME